MAVRGRKPTATVIKLATGNPGRRPLRQDEPIVEGTPLLPPRIRGRAAELWHEVMAFATWLTAADGYKLHIWCELHAEFEKGARKMVASRIAQLRAVGSELGLDPASRSRVSGGKSDGKKADPAAKYF